MPFLRALVQKRIEQTNLKFKPSSQIPLLMLITIILQVPEKKLIPILLKIKLFYKLDIVQF